MKKINFIRSTIRIFLKRNFNLKSKADLVYILEKWEYDDAPESIKAIVRKSEFSKILLDDVDTIWKDYQRKDTVLQKKMIRKPKRLKKPKFKFRLK
jgi:hypothetical protein